MLTLKAFEEAVDVVKKVAMETELIYSDYLSGQTGNKVYLKPENLQVTGAYKIRGAYYKISTLTEEQRTGDRFCREPCPGRSICCQGIWLQGSDRNAYDDASDEG